MTVEKLRELWIAEENVAHIHGWDFSHIKDRYSEEDDLPWEYETEIRKYLKSDMKILDFDTGGGEFLLSLGHSCENTAATEGYPPNIELCREKLIPLGIDFRPCSDGADLPFDDESFDIVINRHGDLNAPEIYRVLKPGGVFITQQVGSKNDRDLVEMVLPGLEEPFPDNTMDIQKRVFESTGFKIQDAQECFNRIVFYDIGAFVWFARIIEWEFPGFSVERCFDNLLQMQDICNEQGKIEGTIHRFFIVARK